MTVKIGVLAIQGSFIEHINCLERVRSNDRFKHLDILVCEIRQVEDVCEDLRGLIIPGGESTTMLTFLNETFLTRLRSWILDSGHPVWGSCAGMILLADKEKGVRCSQKVFKCLSI